MGMLCNPYKSCATCLQSFISRKSRGRSPRKEKLADPDLPGKQLLKWRRWESLNTVIFMVGSVVFCGTDLLHADLS